MARLFRWLLNIASGLILLMVAVAALVYYFASRSLPVYDATTEVTGISAPVEIVRDNANVPHIFGATDADVYFALGYAHGQDRMWQMIMMRRTVQGRMSELFGEETLPIDMLMRRFDLYNAAVASVDAQTPEATVALEAYSAGVNAWFGEVNAGARGRGAPEMWLFNHPVAPWQPADSLAILKLMALHGSTHLEQEVLRARVSLALADDRVEDIMPDAPGRAIATLPMPDFAAMLPALPDPTQEALAIERIPMSPVRGRVFASASNAWAAGITRSAAGASLLANDPHVALTAPSLWYLARLELEGGGVIGGTVPGMPIILSGRSADLGWGIAASYVDDLDIFIEEVNSQNAGLYRTEDGWEEFETRPSIINVADQPGVTIQLQWSRNGPILPPEHYNLGTIRPPGHVTAISWTALSREDPSMSAALALMQSHGIEEGLEAVQDFVAPSLNLVLADRNRIAMRTIGALPRRDAEHVSEGRLPSLGYLAQNRWDGMFPADFAPEYVDPPGGLLGTTNNKIISALFPRHLSFDWGDTQRVQRWQFLMQGRQVHTRDSFIETQLDTVSPTARALLPYIGADLFFTGDAAPEGSPARLRQRALALLGEWNGEMNEHMPEPLIYAAWLRALQDRLIRDELGPLAREFTHVDPIFIARVYADIDGASEWCNVIQSAPIETCSDIARLALDDALVWITETYSADLLSLRWGDAHTAQQDHEVLRDNPLVGWIVNLRQSTSGGDHTLQRGLTAGTEEAPFANVHAAGYRGVYDFADPDSSVFVISTGQSGHPLSRHYEDLGELWRRGEYIPMSLDPALARAGAVGVTTLMPR